MTVRKEIQEIVLRAGSRILAGTSRDLSANEAESLVTDFEARIPFYSGRYPISDLLGQMEGLVNAGRAATITTNAAMKQQRQEPNLGCDERLDGFQTPDTDQWRQAIADSAEEITEDLFRQASVLFEEGRHEEATDRLCSGIICSIAAIAAQRGWPHSDGTDDLSAVVGLATGALPVADADIYQLLLSASEQGQDLNSAFAAAMGQPNAVRTGLFYDSSNGYGDDAMFFATKTVRLAKELAKR